MQSRTHGELELEASLAGWEAAAEPPLCRRGRRAAAVLLGQASIVMALHVQVGVIFQAAVTVVTARVTGHGVPTVPVPLARSGCLS